MTEAPIPHGDGVSVLYCDLKHFTLEALCLHGPKVFRFQLALVRQRWYVVGWYIALDGALTIEDIVAAIGHRSRVEDLLVAGNFNAYLAVPEVNARGKDIDVALANAGLEEMRNHLILCHKP